ncbi:SH3 domain-binding protein 5 homolog [Drosophila sulfurigaster albostrigata]|uniref:SH3 domain-binding protein 5 homolog n=1 Tax=Drosophila sulfurigaster albostrigata TaxID=89887 RepID=UPI002D21CF6C|nr:SH3 domain-binding protein 5 homolog [Drosophila sulfurigaster albostrigata]
MSNTEDSELDPQIQIELENLNSATDEINKLEIELEEANSTFRILLNESTRRLKLSSKKLGNCIEKARPYYDSLDKAREAQIECQQAAVKFQRANEIHAAAKETVALAEQRFMSNSHEWQFDNAWQEMLNHATQKVMDAEKQKADCHAEHQRRTRLFHAAEQKLQQLEDRFRRSINKSRPYFEEKQVCQDQLQTQKNRIQELQQQVGCAKSTYSTALRNLERISEDIHRQRGDYPTLSASPPPPGTREPGVGAELNTPTSSALPSLPDFQLELEKCDYPSIAGSQMSLGATLVTQSSTVETEDEAEDDNVCDYDESTTLGNDLRGIVDERQLEALRQKVKILAVRPIEGGDGQQQNDVWEHELKATVDKLDHLMMLKEAAKHQQTERAKSTEMRPVSLGAEALKRHTDVDDVDARDVIIKITAPATSVAHSLPVTPQHQTSGAATSIKKLQQQLAPLPSVNVSMRELPLLARLSNELLDRSSAAMGSVRRQLRRRSLE